MSQHNRIHQGQDDQEWLTTLKFLETDEEFFGGERMRNERMTVMSKFFTVGADATGSWNGSHKSLRSGDNPSAKQTRTTLADSSGQDSVLPDSLLSCSNLAEATTVTAFPKQGLLRFISVGDTPRQRKPRLNGVAEKGEHQDCIQSSEAREKFISEITSKEDMHNTSKLLTATDMILSGSDSDLFNEDQGRDFLGGFHESLHCDDIAPSIQSQVGNLRFVDSLGRKVVPPLSCNIPAQATTVPASPREGVARSISEVETSGKIL